MFVFNNKEGLVREVNYGSNFSYILDDAAYFAVTDYKIMQSIDAFAKCMKMLHNGKIELYYVIHKCQSIQTYFTGISDWKKIEICVKILEIIREVQANGFLKCYNIDLSPSRIYIEHGTDDVKLVYLPINSGNQYELVEYEGEFRKNIVNIFQNSGCKDEDNHEELTQFIGNIEKLSISIDEVIKNYKHMGAVTGTKSAVNGVRSIADNRFSSPSGVDVFNTVKEVSKSNNISNDKVVDSIFDNEIEEVMKNVTESSRLKMELIKSNKNLVVVLDKEKIVFGRDKAESDVVLAFNINVSRKHCTIINDKGNYMIIDEGSSNGTFINEIKIKPFTENIIKKGDIIRIASSEFVLT